MRPFSDDPSAEVDALDDWDDDDRPRRTPARHRLVGPLVVLGVVGVVVAVVVAGTGSGQGASSAASTADEPPAASRTAASGGPSTDQVASGAPTVVGSATPTPRASTSAKLPALASDDPAEPLRITLLDPVPAAPSAGLIAYRVQVCVSPDSAGVASDRVRVVAANWQLATFPSMDGAQTAVPGVAPQFPYEARLAKGECASGYVTFAWNVVEAPNAIIYNDTRFAWYWRLR